MNDSLLSKGSVESSDSVTSLEAPSLPSSVKISTDFESNVMIIGIISQTTNKSKKKAEVSR